VTVFYSKSKPKLPLLTMMIQGGNGDKSFAFISLVLDVGE
jgi:hypothetical protein